MKRQPLVALAALRRLLANPERTEEAFVIAGALVGDAVQRGQQRFARTEVGRRALAERRELLPLLSDRAALARMPEGSFGRAYLHFVESNGISAAGLVEASADQRVRFNSLTGDELLYANRLREMHDLWHVVSGYSTQPFGEVCVLAFSYPQTRNLGVAVIALIGALKMVREGAGRGVLRAAWQAYRNGKRAAWLPAADWEALMPLPLAEVRRRLNLRAPTAFQTMTDYRGDWDAALPA